MPKFTPVSQKGTGGSSAKQGTSTGSGSRPGGSKFTIPSTAPKNAKKHRG